MIFLYNIHADAWRLQYEFMKYKHIGRPQATKTHTVEQLEAMGYVGVYALDAESAPAS